MAKSKKTDKSKKKSIGVASAPRKLKSPNYKHFKLAKKIKHPDGPLPGSFRLLARSLRHIWDNKRIFLLLTIVYVFLTLLFVKGLSLGNSATNGKDFLQSIFDGNTKSLSSGFTAFSYLLGSSNNASSDVASLYQTILLVVMSLALVWVLRQTYAKQKVSLKDAFYRSQYPLVQFLLVIGVILIQLLPLLIASAFYGYIFGNGLAVNVAEKTVWLVLFFMLSVLSLYMVSSSIFAIYIVTLPDVTPLNALRSARQLVRYRRWTVLRKVVFLPVALLVMLAVIGLPLIMYLTPVAVWGFFFVTMFGLLIVHSYLYGLYRELL